MLKKTSKFIYAFILGSIIIFSYPLLTFGAGLVPDCNTGEVLTIPAVRDANGVIISPEKYEYANPCDFNVIMQAINNIIDFLLTKIITPLFALILVYVGWLYLSSMGSSENKTKAKKILKNSVIGFVIALAAWLIVKTILTTLGFTGGFLS